MTSKSENSAPLKSRLETDKEEVSRPEMLVIIALYLFSLYRIATEFLHQSYDWDIDHEIYFGQQLLQGNLLWSVEYHDKLPVLQYFFAIAAAFDNPLIVWRLISLFSAVLSIICVIHLLPELLIRAGHPANRARKVAMLSGGIYLCVATTVPGGLTHINVMSSSMAIVATLLTFTLVRSKKKSWGVFGTSILAGLAAALSISIRPYFVFPFAIVCLIIGLIIASEKTLNLKQKCFRIACLALAPIVIGIGLNFGPYLLFGKVGAIYSGLSFMLQPLPAGGSIMKFILNPGYKLGWIFALWLSGMSLYSLFEIGMNTRKGRAGLVAVLIPLSAVSLLAAILSQHFWVHYINLFSWYFAILFAIRIVSLDPIVSSLLQVRLARFFSPTTLTSLGFSILLVLMSLFNVGKLSNEHPYQPLVKALQKRFLGFPLSRPIFLAPENMYVHWKLKESRHGFPHAANTIHIFNGLWSHTGGIHSFRHPTSTEAYCVELIQSPVEAVILRNDSELQPCFSNLRKQWRLEPLLKKDSEIWNLWIRN